MNEMAISAVDFLSCAEQLLNDNATEVDVRSSSSRAYYAAYHVALEKAGDIDILDHIDVEGGMHKQLRKKYELSGLKGAKQVADLLAKLHRARVAADYHLCSPYSKNEAKMQIGLVKKAIEKVNEISS